MLHVCAHTNKLRVSMLNMIYGTMWDFYLFPHNVQNVNGLFAKLGSISEICEHIQVWITCCSTDRVLGLICSNDIYFDSSIMCKHLISSDK